MKKILLFLLCIFSFTIYICSAQQFTFVKQWDERFGGNRDDALRCLNLSVDNGFILGGYSTSDSSGDKTQPFWGTNNSFSDYWIIRIDSAGNKEWDKRFGGSSPDDLIKVISTKDKGYILGGHSGSGPSGDKTETNWGGVDAWIVKVDSVGNKMWDKRYGGTKDDWFRDIIETSDNGYILAITTSSPASGDKTESNWDSANFYFDMWIVKIDSAGNKLWDKRFGGLQDDGFGSIIQTADNGYVLAGTSLSGVSGDKTQTSWGGSDGWVVKIDSIGNKLWDKRFGGSMDDGFGILTSSSDNNYILLGNTLSPADGDKTENKTGYWLVKIDSFGNKIWDRTFSDAYSVQGLCRTLDNGYLISGVSTANAGLDKSENNLAAYQTWIVKTDTVGNKEWDKTIFTTKRCEGYAIQTTDGCYAVGASTASGIGGYKTQTNWDSTETTYDYWIMKFCMDTVTGIDDRRQTTDDRQIQVWPNPFTGDLSIALKGENIHEATFTITNAMGQVIYKKEETNLSSNYTKVLDLSYLPNGIYFVVVTIKGESTAKRVVKE